MIIYMHVSHSRKMLLQEEELKKTLVESLDLLTEKERKVIELYYYEEMTLKEISKILEVSESRISQLHTKALVKMKKTMGTYMDILIDLGCDDMAIGPIDYAMIQRTNDVEMYKMQEETKPFVDQQNIQVQVVCS